MTSEQWLASDDPRAMLYQLLGREPQGDQTEWGRMPAATDRKLRLFACAVAHAHGHDPASVGAVEACVEAGQPDHNFDDRDAADGGQFWRLCTSVRAAYGAAAAYGGAHTAALLREVVGDPWRPATLPPGPSCPECHGEQYVRRKCHACGSRGALLCPWLTPDVLCLARAAYEDRPGQECPTCKGTKKVFWNVGPYESSWDACEACDGTGRIDGGALDPLTLAALADALEEAGCCDDDLLRHLRGQEMCRTCQGDAAWLTCDSCNPRRLPWDLWSPWVPLPGPHVRGCWAVDLVLGRG